MTPVATVRDQRPPSGDAWTRVRREIAQVAGQPPGQVQPRQLRRASALLRYHACQIRNPAYRELLQGAGVDPEKAGQPPETWHQVPVVDKQWLARAGYDGGSGDDVPDAGHPDAVTAPAG